MRLMRMGLAVYGALVRRSHVPHSVLAQGHQGWYVLGRTVDLYGSGSGIQAITSPPIQSPLEAAQSYLE